MVHVDFDCPVCGTTLSNCSYWLGPISVCWECEAKLTVTLPAGYRWKKVRVPACQSCGKRPEEWDGRHMTSPGEGYCERCGTYVSGWPSDDWGDYDYEAPEPGFPEDVRVDVLVE